MVLCLESENESFIEWGFFGMYKTFQFSCLQRHEYIGVIAFTELNGVFECCRYCAHKIRAIPISMRKWRVHILFSTLKWQDDHGRDLRTLEHTHSFSLSLWRWVKCNRIMYRLTRTKISYRNSAHTRYVLAILTLFDWMNPAQAGLRTKSAT